MSKSQDTLGRRLLQRRFSAIPFADMSELPQPSDFDEREREKIAALLKEWREKVLGIGQQELAQRARVSIGTIRSWEQSGVPQYFGRISRVIAALGIEPGSLESVDTLSSVVDLAKMKIDQVKRSVSQRDKRDLDAYEASDHGEET